MKKELCFIMIVLLTLALLICGCQEQLVKPDLRSELFNLQPQGQAKWNEKYSDSLDSKQTCNIAVIVQVINKQGEAMKQLDRRLIELEIVDTNDLIRYGEEVNIESKVVYYDSNSDIRWTKEKYYYITKRDPNKKYWEEYDK